ncbi:MAG: AI-2E family transporter [Acidobacteriia bacterium]|nr:AI-2E family transporter [Terriglobia bacterium]
MAVITKPLGAVTKAVEEVRHYSLPVMAGGVVIAILYFGRVFFITSIIAIMIAFILEPFVVLLVRLRLPRGVASFVVCALALSFLYVVSMGVYAQLSTLYAQLPVYGQRIGDLVDSVQQKLETAEQQTYRMVVPGRQRKEEELARAALLAAEQQARTKRRAQTPTTVTAPLPGVIPEVRIHEDKSPIGGYIFSGLTSFYQVLLMASFVPFLVYFMLSWRDHINRSFLQFFRGEDRMIAARSLEGIAGIVRGFVVGNFLLGLLLAFASSLIFWWMRLPFPLLAGALSGFLSLVPYIGLPVAMVPPLFAALSVNQIQVYVGVLVTVAVLHLSALNVLYPKVVGARVHLNPLVVTFSLMLWGFLWDAAGLLLAIPLTAALKAVCDNIIALRPFGKFLGD